IGFTTGSGAGTDYNFPWAIHLSTVGIAEIRENGGYVAEWTYATGDTFRIAIASGVITYTHNGGAPHTSAVSPTYPVKVDSSISTLNGQISNVLISGSASSAAPTAWKGPVTDPATGPNHNELQKTAGVDPNADAAEYSPQV